MISETLLFELPPQSKLYRLTESETDLYAVFWVFDGGTPDSSSFDLLYTFTECFRVLFGVRFANDVIAAGGFLAVIR